MHLLNAAFDAGETNARWHHADMICVDFETVVQGDCVIVVLRLFDVLL